MQAMINKDFLKLGNHRKIINVYSDFLDEKEISKISSQIKSHTKLIYELALDHYKFAASLGCVDKMDSQGVLNVIQAGICDGDRLGARFDVR
ncbi:hypothetical protein [Paracoccus yeei]|uniref:hypothetical protein n=1 Tax=Paracoccus yeei TaxID=147645 RepID=UPI003BF82B89